ncbi:DnaJ-domain-containing protein [Obba rivulosa]|uniref:DnaJ-domain-containing protein n=1 Tax=Obba rivulosa TaxID=1052685 RepID=A0A8E2J3P1_9APHY|nr:DnaJ-domain-containing protein [Obba rivulosa]
MPYGREENGDASESPESQNYYYTVLNLPPTASDQEVRDRYRQLSVIFHPDKQHDETTKDTATKRFLEIQKAYEVLSDPISRRAYDVLGSEGLEILKYTDLSNVPVDELEHVLKTTHRGLERKRLETLVRQRGGMTIGIDASSLFEQDEDYFYGPRGALGQRLLTRVGGIHRDRFSVRHSVSTDLNSQTSVTLTGTALARDVDSPDGVKVMRRGAIWGTVRHQYSPRINFEATASLLRILPVKFRTTYRDNDTTLSVGTTVTRSKLQRGLSVSTWRSSIPALDVVLSRRLFKNCPMQGNIVLNTSGILPIVAINVSSGQVFDVSLDSSVAEEKNLDLTMRPPTSLGLARWERQWTFGVTLADLRTNLNGQCLLELLELGVSFKLAVELGILTGLNWIFGGEWRRNNTAIGASINLSLEGVTLDIELVYLGQSYSIPIRLSHDREPLLAFITTAVPSVTFLLSYIFILRPRQRWRRIEFFREAKRELREQKSDLLRESKETICLLQETARRHMQAEATSDGLIILEAMYGPSERDDSTDGLDVDMTIPVQALVNKSQLYIPRGDKAGLQGFYDPVPNAAKMLRIRYTFRGREHYAEIPDYKPVVLPLEEHMCE